MRVVLAALVCLAFLAPRAEALNLERLRMPAPDGAVIHTAECPHFPSGGSCAVGAEIWISPRASRFTAAHELGHAFDVLALQASTREWLTPRLGFPAGTPWDADSEDLAPIEPAEVFADAYAHCALGTRPRGLIVYGYLPGRAQHRRVCNAIAVLGLVAGYQSEEPPKSTR